MICRFYCQRRQLTARNSWVFHLQDEPIFVGMLEHHNASILQSGARQFISQSFEFISVHRVMHFMTYRCYLCNQFHRKSRQDKKNCTFSLFLSKTMTWKVHSFFSLLQKDLYPAFRLRYLCFCQTGYCQRGK